MFVSHTWLCIVRKEVKEVASFLEAQSLELTTSKDQQKKAAVD